MLIERRNDEQTTAPPIDKGVTAAWEDLRCRQCRRLLARNTRSALRPGEMLEIKCGHCNVRNYLVGMEAELC